MSITRNSIHSLDDGIETYSFPTATRETQYRHLIDRVDDGPWQIWPLESDGAMDLDAARVYVRELNELIEFADNLNQPELRRSTAPGAPAFEAVV